MKRHIKRNESQPVQEPDAKQQFVQELKEGDLQKVNGGWADWGGGDWGGGGWGGGWGGFACDNNSPVW